LSPQAEEEAEDKKGATEYEAMVREGETEVEVVLAAELEEAGFYIIDQVAQDVAEDLEAVEITQITKTTPP
jgi:pyridoxine/pyridoxamine 5'-phosphate oxidase